MDHVICLKMLWVIMRLNFIFAYMLVEKVQYTREQFMKCQSLKTTAPTNISLGLYFIFFIWFHFKLEQNLCSV